MKTKKLFSLLCFCTLLVLLMPFFAKADPPSTSCTDNSTCPSGQFCGSDHTCYTATSTPTTSCADNSQCPSGQQCTNNVCIAATDSRTVIKLPNFLGVTQVSDVIGRVIQIIIGLVGSFALIIFIYGGGLWLISAGRKEYVDKGKKAMIWAAVGLAVVFASYILVNTVFNVLQQT